MEKRNSKLEIVRIISIVLIVLSHYVMHSGYDVHHLPIGFNRYILEISILGNIGTMLFVLISGYFLIDSNEIKFKKLFRFVAQVLFYSIIIYLLLVILKIEIFDIKSLILNLFPITFKRYWFATTYFVLYLFHPFINKFLNSIQRDEHLRFILFGVSIFYILSTLTTMDFYGNELVYFVFLYSIGAYFSKYKDNKLCKNNNSFKIMCASIIIIALSIIILDLIGTKISYVGNHSTYLLNMYSIFALMLSSSIFCVFSTKKPSTNKIINYISSLVFGIYLISDNKYLRSIIWCDLFKNNNYFSSNYLIIHIIASVIIVCCICVLIELIRKTIFNKCIFKYLDEKIVLLEKKVRNKIKE